MSFVYNTRRGLVLEHISCELIASAGYGHNKAVFVGVFFKRFAQAGYVAGEIIFLHHRVWPNESHQLVLLHDSVAVLKQNQQYIEGFRGQGDLIASA